MVHLKGSYLKEVTFDLLLDSPLSIEKAKSVLQYLIKFSLKTKIVSSSVNILNPGFDLTLTIKESIVYLGYWPEYNYVHLIVSSCKNFNEIQLKSNLENFLLSITHIQMNIHSDTTIKKIIKTFSCYNY